MRPRKGDIKIRRRDKSIFLADAPDWWDDRCKIKTITAPGLMDDIYLVHPEHPVHKLNRVTRQFEPCNIVLPADPEPARIVSEPKKENPILHFWNRFWRKS